jgi:3-dehydroquinate synthase
MKNNNASVKLATSRVNINLQERSYEILIGENLLKNADIFKKFTSSSQAIIVSNSIVAPIYAAQLSESLKPHFKTIHLLILPDGEEYKTWETLNLIFDELIKHRCDRKTVLFALGGGVVGDMVGFAAASYMRGIPYVQIPTTLLAQVDSSVGGKTAINHPLGKNMVGAFYQPLGVVCDLQTLHSLPEREFSAGLAEVIKYGPIADWGFFEWLELNLDTVLKRDMVALSYIVQRCCEIKAHVVAEDERESDLRAILNFGHTFAHAIETGLGYGKWLHGEAVGCGMVMAADLSFRLGLINSKLAMRLKELIKRAGLPVSAPTLEINGNPEKYMDLMRIDKKADEGKIRFIVINGKGRAQMTTADDSIVKSVISANCSV